MARALLQRRKAALQPRFAGTQVIAVVPDNVWVVANYKETQLTHVAIGQRAEIRVDTFPGRHRRDNASGGSYIDGFNIPCAAVASF